MKDTDYNLGTFAFSETNAVWEHIMYIIDLNIQAETQRAIANDITGEARIHQCGRANSITDFKALLLEERRKARVQAGLTPE